jgi:hypothetical protein
MIDGTQASARRAVPAADPPRAAQANVNLSTGLSSDYLNHFNEAVMLLDMLAELPESAADLAAWRPLTYREHFAGSRLKHRGLTLELYDRADAATVRRLEAVCATMNAAIVAVCRMLRTDLPFHAKAVVARQVAAALKPLIARASAIIHGGEGAAEVRCESNAQATVDALLAP